MIATTKSRGAVGNRPDHTRDILKKAAEKGMRDKDGSESN